jgi:hypothetical protein
MQTPDEPVMAELRVTALPPKIVNVRFHKVSDAVRSSMHGAQHAQELLDAMNVAWTSQANVAFRPLVADFVSDTIAAELGPVVQCYDLGGPPFGPCAQSGMSDFELVIANEAPSVPYDVFFVWNFEKRLPT